MLAACLTFSYDVLGHVISVLDVTTDIIVCIGFYQKDRMVFFAISFTILYSKETPLSKFLVKHCCGFNIEMDPDHGTSLRASKLRQFMESKVEKHFGFILEALVEAFPQAILQMIAIVVYNEANVIAIISILVSMLSMASKSFIFSVASAITIKQLMWNW
eukprot:479296_1